MTKPLLCKTHRHHSPLITSNHFHYHYHCHYHCNCNCNCDDVN